MLRLVSEFAPSNKGIERTASGRLRKRGHGLPLMPNTLGGLGVTSMLFDERHWELQPARELAPFFVALPELVGPTAVLCLAMGSWYGELMTFLDGNSVARPDSADVLRVRDRHLRCVQCDPTVLAELARLSDQYAEPEVAEHLNVTLDGLSVLEWFDMPGDPFSVSTAVPEPKVRAFAARLGVHNRMVGG